MKTETPDYRPFRVLAGVLHKHPKGCKERLLSECRICTQTVAKFSTFPLPALSYSLTERQVAEGRSSMAELCVDAMIRRADHKSKRASLDFAAAYPVLKTYEQRGGGL